MAEQKNPQGKTAGEILKEAREAKGTSLMTVHEATNIPLDVLKAIEEGYSVRTLSPFYFKGFIKMYAEYLGIDAVRVMERPIPVLEKKKDPEPKIKKVEDKVYHVPGEEFDLNTFVSKEKQRQIVQGIGVLIAVFFLARVAGCLMRKNNRKAEDAPPPVVQQPVSPKAAAEQKLIVAPPVAPAAPSSSTVIPPAPAASSAPAAAAPVEERSVKIRLVIKVLKGGWLQVRVDGEVMVESTLNAGTVKRWEADEEIIISGRMIHNLEFELNGKMLGTLGRKDRNAHRVIVNKKGLSVSE